MEQTDQDIFIFLRLRKGIQGIASELGLSLEETERRVQSVAHILACHNSLHLIRNPEFVPLPGETGDRAKAPCADSSISVEENSILSEFLRYFSEALQRITPEEKSLLKLYFYHQWPRTKILSFYQKALFPLPGKDRKTKGTTQKELSESLNEAIGNLLKSLRRLLGEEAAGASPSVKDLITILEEAGDFEGLW